MSRVKFYLLPQLSQGPPFWGSPAQGVVLPVALFFLSTLVQFPHTNVYTSSVGTFYGLWLLEIAVCAQFSLSCLVFCHLTLSPPHPLTLCFLLDFCAVFPADLVDLFLHPFNPFFPQVREIFKEKLIV